MLSIPFRQRPQHEAERHLLLLLWLRSQRRCHRPYPKLFDLNPRQAAEKLIHDFGLDPDKPPANAIALPPPKRGLTDEQWADIAYCLRVLIDYLDLLHDWQERYKPATPEEPHDPRFEEALHTTETIEHLTDCVAFGTSQQKAAAAAQLLSGSYLLMLEERTDRLALAKCA